jgi:hypothetical protein
MPRRRARKAQRAGQQLDLIVMHVWQCDHHLAMQWCGSATVHPVLPNAIAMAALYTVETMQRVNRMGLDMLGPQALEMPATPQSAQYQYLSSFMHTIGGVRRKFAETSLANEASACRANAEGLKGALAAI